MSVKNAWRFHWKSIQIRQTKQGGTKSEKMERQGEQKWSQGHQKWSKGHQKWAKRVPKVAQSEPEGAKRVTKGNHNQHKIDIKEKVAKSMRKRYTRTNLFDAILGCIFMKNRWKKLRKNQCRNNREKWWNIDAKTERTNKMFRKMGLWKNVFFERDECVKNIWFTE